MLIRIYFGDNDFSIPIFNACEAVKEDISRGYSGEILIEKFKNHIKEYELDDIRQRIVIGCVGFVMANNGARGRFNSKQFSREILTDYYGIFDYLNKIIRIENVKNYSKCDDNGEACYIDLYQNKIFMC